MSWTKVLIRPFIQPKSICIFLISWWKHNVEVLLMNTHNICFCQEKRRLVTWYPHLSRPMSWRCLLTWCSSSVWAVSSEKSPYWRCRKWSCGSACKSAHECLCYLLLYLNIYLVYSDRQTQYKLQKNEKKWKFLFSDLHEEDNKLIIFRPSSFSVLYMLGSMLLCFLSVFCKEQGITVIVSIQPWLFKKE